MINFILNITENTLKSQGIELDNISSVELTGIDFEYEYGKKTLFFNRLQFNQNTQLVGGNGCGKSSLLNLLNYRFTNWKGQIRFNNIDLDFLNNEQLKNQTILINNDVFLPTGTIYDFLISGKYEYQTELLNNIKKYNLDKLMEKLSINLDMMILNNGSNFSSGQKQFLIILKLFTRNFKMILLDEAFENIDINIFEALQKCIKDYQKDSFFIEISHNKKYLYTDSEVNFEEINKI